MIIMIVIMSVIISGIAGQDECYKYVTPVTLTNNMNKQQTDFLIQMNTSSMVEKGFILDYSNCFDLEFYDGSSKLNHWFETTCPGKPAVNGISNIWIRGIFTIEIIFKKIFNILFF